MMNVYYQTRTKYSTFALFEWTLSWTLRMNSGCLNGGRTYCNSIRWTRPQYFSNFWGSHPRMHRHLPSNRVHLKIVGGGKRHVIPIIFHRGTCPPQIDDQSSFNLIGLHKGKQSSRQGIEVHRWGANLSEPRWLSLYPGFPPGFPQPVSKFPYRRDVNWRIWHPAGAAPACTTTFIHCTIYIVHVLVHVRYPKAHGPYNYCHSHHSRRFSHK